MRFFATLSGRDRRALRVLGWAVALAALWWAFGPSGSFESAAASVPVEALEQRYLLARERFERQPERQRQALQLSRSAARLESRLLRSPTAALAQAQLRSLVAGLLHDEGVSLEQSSFGPTGTSGPYLAVPIGLEFVCGIEQFVRFAAALANASPILATRSIELARDTTQAAAVRVRLTIEGYLPREAAPGQDAGGIR